MGSDVGHVATHFGFYGLLKSIGILVSNFYNVGLYSTLIALGIDFIGLDLLIVLVLTILKLRPE